ncbi:hypothetical protein Ae201684_007626 [Aphanomyces euteiches]|uniref:Uncharacterized protein n=1 Tax=Aphanomyces euteiches TaxID=100861 RepID=A0A6G0X7Q1_9STRA|nr:hypothetical protein Ae201684_007626 [Aphanomyces euteiches]
MCRFAPELGHRARTEDDEASSKAAARKEANYRASRDKPCTTELSQQGELLKSGRCLHPKRDMHGCCPIFSVAWFQVGASLQNQSSGRGIHLTLSESSWYFATTIASSLMGYCLWRGLGWTTSVITLLSALYHCFAHQGRVYFECIYLTWFLCSSAPGKGNKPPFMPRQATSVTVITWCHGCFQAGLLEFMHPRRDKRGCCAPPLAFPGYVMILKIKHSHQNVLLNHA